MHWKLKALLQNVVDCLPSPLSYQAYYYLQRRFGALRYANPFPTAHGSLEIADGIHNCGGRIEDGVILEVGTGRRVILPIIMWLLGAKSTITVDLHPYLKVELVAEDLNYFQSHHDQLVNLLRGRSYVENRLDQLMNMSVESLNIREMLEMWNIQYLAPADATRLPLAEGSVDFQVSRSVFEHIPRSTLVAITKESGRVLRDGGLAVHRIDHSDHFSHSDSSLSAINFLQYTEKQWERLAGNRYMYMNRLQLDDFQEIFQQGGLEVLSVVSEPNQEVLKLLQSSDLLLDSRFAKKPTATLATLNSLLVSRPYKKEPIRKREHAA